MNKEGKIVKEDIKDIVSGETKLKEQIEFAKNNGDFKTEYNLIGRLLNKYKKFLSKVNKMPIKHNFSEEKKEELVRKINELIFFYRYELRGAYKNAIKKLGGKKNLDENGELRKEYIKYIDEEITNLLKKSELNTEEKNYLALLEKEFSQLVKQYKINLDNRKKDNLSQTGNNLVSTVIKLPKGCLLAIKKIEVCIKDVRNAKNNKEKTMKIMEVAKASGSLLTTPIVYLGKWAINSILLITIGSSLGLTNDKFRKFIDNIKTKFNDLNKDIKEENLGKINPVMSTNGIIR